MTGRARRLSARLESWMGSSLGRLVRPAALAAPAPLLFVAGEPSDSWHVQVCLSCKSRSAAVSVDGHTRLLCPPHCALMGRACCDSFPCGSVAGDWIMLGSVATLLGKGALRASDSQRNGDKETCLLREGLRDQGMRRVKYCYIYCSWPMHMGQKLGSHPLPTHLLTGQASAT